MWSTAQLQAPSLPALLPTTPNQSLVFFMFLPFTACCNPRPAKGGYHKLTLEKRRRTTAVRLSRQLREVTGVVDPESIRGGRRNRGPMAGLAEAVGR